MSQRDEKTKRDSDEFLTRDDEEKSFVTIQFSRSKEKQTKTVLKVLSKGNKLILLDFLITLKMPFML